MDYKLFSTDSSTSGFRLQYMEVYNWGTFHDKVWRINPEGNTTLLTGANASGKTTFIDALLTLMVPYKKDRFYNQSSGEEKKGARTEESYVLGHYGKKQNEGDLSATVQALRDETAISILLATFKNEDDKYCTIFQCRWFSNGDLKKQFGLAHKGLRIEEDFFPFDTRRKWKDNLMAKHPDTGRGNPIEYFSGPGDYAERMVRLFGMRSNKALSLFNQVVGIKYVEDLDLFFRNYMLEDKDVNSHLEYKELIGSFNELTKARNDIEKAEEQIKQLEPITEYAKKITTTTNQLKDLEISKHTSAYWFSAKGKELSEKEHTRLEKVIENIESKIKIIDAEIDKLRDKEAELKVDIKSSEAGRQTEALEKEIKDLNIKLQERSKALTKYNALAQSLSFKENPSEKVFNDEKEEALIKKTGCETKDKNLNKAIRIEENKRDESRKNIETTKDSISTLIKNDNNIPTRVARIREDILEAVGANKNEIPFIGELIKVDENNQNWELGIEKLLHSFALRIIVPEKYYKAVNKYVNNTNLNGKIFYYRYKETDTLLDNRIQDSDKTVYSKLNFKPDSNYKNWVQEQIFEQFNFYCADDLLDFENSKRALTKEGLINFGRGRHQKDDRNSFGNRSSYVLGWDNKANIKNLREFLTILTDDETNAIKEIARLENKIEVNKNQRDNYYDFVNSFENFDSIYWEKYAEEIQGKKDEIQAIAESDDILNTLKTQLEKTSTSITDKTIELDNIKESRGIEKGKMSTANDLIKSNSTILSSLEGIEVNTQKFEELNPQVIEVTYSNLQEVQNNLLKDVNGKVKTLELSKKDYESDCLLQMRSFVIPEPEIQTKFPSWLSDTNGLKVKIELIEGFTEKYDDLKTDNLPKFQNQFNELLQQTILQNVVKFKQFFATWEIEIEETIASLNEALKNIVFKTTPSETYLQLKADYKTSKFVEEFKSLLKNATPNFREYDSLESKKIHFDENIEPLITRLKDENWRTIVMDVRRWYEYKTDELYKASDNQTNTVSDMSGLSGGEKASLTYTVLGSAIAYQFGLTSNNFNNNSFRFIAIDEAFKAQDPEHSEFLMKLCRQLELQLLVVTPSDNMKVVQPYISYVHLVERQDEKDSAIYNMPIEVYEEGEKKYKAV